VPPPQTALVGWYDARVVAVSIAMAVLGSYAALDLAERVAASDGRVRRQWVIAASTAQATGIWAMHYTGMLAFHLPVVIRYHWPTALLSFLYALAGAGSGFVVISRPTAGRRTMFAAGTLVGLGIIALHYTSMGSMRAAVMHNYSAPLATLSVVFAIAFSFCSLRFMVMFRTAATGRWPGRLGGIALMSAAICLMHYTAMAAMTFTAAPPADFSHAVQISSLGVLGVAAVAISGLAVSLIGSALDRLSRQRDLLRALSARVSAAKEEEGVRISRELHDELGAALTSLKWDVEKFASDLGTASGAVDAGRLRDRLAAMSTLIDSTMGAVRRIATELRPSMLDDLGLLDTIEWQAHEFETRSGIPVCYRAAASGVRLSRDEAIAVFRILQEALTNVLRHARASHVDITASIERGHFVLRVADDGRGMKPQIQIGGPTLGIVGMRERATLVGGTLEIAAGAAGGTEVTVRVPVGRRALQQRAGAA
jgi:signal transduction histidine kinase